jgi:hypothetical protein
MEPENAMRTMALKQLGAALLNLFSEERQLDSVANLTRQAGPDPRQQRYLD